MAHGSTTRRGLTAALAVALLALVAPAAAQTCPSGQRWCQDPTPPPPIGSPPDMALQFSECRPLLVSPSVAPPELVSLFMDLTLADAIKDALADLDANGDDYPYRCSTTVGQVCVKDSDCPPVCPDCAAHEPCRGPRPDVRHACVNGTGGVCVPSATQSCTGYKLTFGVWFRPVGSYSTTDSATNRNVGLSRVNVLSAGEEFAFFFRALGVLRLVDIAWADQPKRLNTNNQPDPTGPRHLTTRNLAFYQEATTAVVHLTIDGYHDGPTSDTSFRLNVYDDLTANGSLGCSTESTAGATETTPDLIGQAIIAVFTGGGQLGNFINEGPGCRIARLLPTTVLLPGIPTTTRCPVPGTVCPGHPEKLVYAYTRVTAQPFGSPNNGVTFAGTWSRVFRIPSVEIMGRDSVNARPGDLFEGEYRVATTDLRPPLSVVWLSEDAAPIVATVTDVTTPPAFPIVWDLPWLGLNQEVERLLMVGVRDAEGLVATDTRTVVLRRSLDIDPPCLPGVLDCPLPDPLGGP